MKKTSWILLTVMLALMCSCRTAPSDTSSNDTIYSLAFPSEAVELFDNTDAGLQLLNYCNVVQTGESQYRMYYIAVPNGDRITDFANNLYVAYSDDLVHWDLGDTSDGSRMLMKNIVEQYVCYIEGDEYPYRMVGNIWEDDKYKLCMWFSKDGLEFVNRVVVLDDRMHDSQCVLVPEDGYFKLYLRTSVKLGPGNYNRRIAMCHLDMQGRRITDVTFVAGNRLYNSAASKLDENTELLLPTFFDNQPGLDDSIHMTAFIQKGLYSHEIDCPLNDRLADWEKWALCAPGILTKDGKKYIVYNSRNTSHDEGRIDRSLYKLVEIEINKEAWK